MAFLFLQTSATKCNRISPVLFRKNNLLFPASLMKSTSMKASTKTTVAENKEIAKSVFISQSRDIYTNLALEDWLYKNFDFTNHHVMLLWRNNPCVVIGLHQNPWLEVDLEKLDKAGADFARRNSGAGSICMDKGNLNITFFSSVDRYNRKQNLELLSRTLEREWSLHPELNKEEIVLENDNKIPGTDKVGRQNSYHQCTLAVDEDKEQLNKSLKKDEMFSITTNATQSVPPSKFSLNDFNNTIAVDDLISAVGWSYLRTSAVTHKDEGWSFVEKQRGFQMINPTDDWFPGLEKTRAEYSSWDWKFGKTPKFTIFKKYELSETTHGVMRIGMLVEKGVVEEVLLYLPDGVTWGGLTGTVPLISTVTGQKFAPTIFAQIEEAIRLQPIKFVEEPTKRVEIAARV
ncbi:lipoyl amidotransferase LIPT1, mitochondrial-like [Rhodnius prolixus]|uniref:BPL/LPL catalytic domain-containing protein n=1 Tax=Rhodnius prolixus TaxID=13249 RepID=T1HS08_RHOPR